MPTIFYILKRQFTTTERHLYPHAMEFDRYTQIPLKPREVGHLVLPPGEGYFRLESQETSSVLHGEPMSQIVCGSQGERLQPFFADYTHQGEVITGRPRPHAKFVGSTLIEVIAHRRHTPASPLQIILTRSSISPHTGDLETGRVLWDYTGTDVWADIQTLIPTPWVDAVDAAYRKVTTHPLIFDVVYADLSQFPQFLHESASQDPSHPKRE